MPSSAPLFLCLLTWPQPKSPLFPYTTLFRSLSSSSVTGLATSFLLPLHAPRRLGCLRRRLRRRLLRSRAVAAPVSDRKSTRLNSSHVRISYAVFCLKKKSRRRCGEGLVGRRP